MKAWLDVRRLTVLGTALYAGIFLLMLAIHPGTDQFYTDFNNSYQILAPAFAAVCGFAYAWSGNHQSKTTRWGWFLIGGGALSFAVGQSTWTLYESVLRVPELPSPGPADIGYLGAYPLLIAGVVLLFGGMRIAGRARLVLDSVSVTSSVALLSWYFLVAQLWHNPDVTLLSKLISVAYPLGDVAVLLCAMILFHGARSDDGLRRSLVFLASGIVLLAFADTAYTYYNLHNAYETGSWFDWGWSFGWILIGYASLASLWWPHTARVSSVPTAVPRVLLPASFRVVAPYLAIVIAFVVILRYDMRADGWIRVNVVLAVAGFVLLVILRQILTLFENQQLTSQLRMFNLDLEHKVAQRTEQLAALLHLTKQVNTTLQVDQVMGAAMNSTCHVLQADAVTLQLTEDDTQWVGPPRGSMQHMGLEQVPEIVCWLEHVPTSTRAAMLPVPVVLSDKGVQAYYLFAPLRWQQRRIGQLGVLRWTRSFTDDEAEMLESIGVEVGAALENARLYATARNAADCDPVTSLRNHRAIHQHLDEELLLAAQHHRPLTVIMIDLNNFKLFNDTYGHPVGDQVLKRVAHVLLAECRATDLLGRYGGDEFLVILPNTDASTAFTIAERLRATMARDGFRRSEEQRTVPVTLSCGLATYPPDGSNRHELLTIADANLYAAKQSDGGIRGTSDAQRANLALRTENMFEVLDALVTAVDNKDRYTRRHSEDVTEYALWLAEALGLSEETLRIIRIGCLLHDVGKIGVPDEILRKPGRLTQEEVEVMNRHPRLGAFIVGALPGMATILDIVRSHHERWDGAGYPDGLKGEQIPLLSRVAALADAFSAMTTDRPYRKGLDVHAALEEIRRNAGTQFDPIITEHFIRAVKQRMWSGAGAINARFPSGKPPRRMEYNTDDADTPDRVATAPAYDDDAITLSASLSHLQ